MFKLQYITYLCCLPCLPTAGELCFVSADGWSPLLFIQVSSFLIYLYNDISHLVRVLNNNHYKSNNR